MKKYFGEEIRSPKLYDFVIEGDGLYVILIKANCRPGWRNKWWLRLKTTLEEILDLHLDDDDLRIELDNYVFEKPNGRKGLFNSPAAFSGTKILGKTKTVILIVNLLRGKHALKFIPDGSPYLESVEVRRANNPRKLAFYVGEKAEDENYYSWYTFVTVDQPLTSIYIKASAGVVQQDKDDDDLKIAIDGTIKKREDNVHRQAYFCGFTLKGKYNVFEEDLSFGDEIHYIELFADKTPTLDTIKLRIGEEQTPLISDPLKTEDTFNPQYLIKDTAFIDGDSMGEEEIEQFLKQYGEKYPNHLYYKTFDGKKASFWIKKYAIEFEINPKVILTKLQIEGRLILGELAANPTPEQLNWALAVGKTDTGTLTQYEGFLTQIKEGPKTFNKLYSEVKDTPFNLEGIDGKTLTIINRSTYSLYRYTPHIEGADLFYRLYNQFFGNDDLGGKM